MKRIIFNPNYGFGEINERIEKMKIINFTLFNTKYNQKILIKEMGIASLELKTEDIKKLLREMYLKIYNYNFIEIETKGYEFISEKAFNNFFSNCESELMSNIQSKKIENIDEVYRKMTRHGVTMTFMPKENNSDNREKWTTIEPTDEELNQMKVKRERQIEENEIKKVILKSLYYLQKVCLDLNELEELIKIYDDYVKKIINLAVTDGKNVLVRYVIHSICILEKIYMTKLRIKKEKIKLNVFKILSFKSQLENITYELLEGELIKCLLIKSESGDYTFKKITPSFYLTTPLRMSCLSYVNLITAMNCLIIEKAEEDKNLEEILKNSFTKGKEYNKFLSGAKLLTLLSLKKFLKSYHENNTNITQSAPRLNSMMYSLYFQYEEKNKIANNYSDKDIEAYEDIKLDYVKAIKEILKTKILYNFISDRIEVALGKEESDFKVINGRDYVIHLDRENIIKNTKEISLSLFEDKDNIKKEYIATSRSVLFNENLKMNDDYCLAKFLCIKHIDEKEFYIFEMSVIIQETKNNRDIHGTQIITFILTKEDFEVIGRVVQITYCNF